MLATENLSFSYGMVQAIRGVTLKAERASITCVMGRNGVGKTTLMRTLMGSLRHSAGTIRLGDEDIGGLPSNERARAGLALVPQGRQIFAKLSVVENLRVGLQARADRGRTIPAELYELFPILKTMAQRMGGDLSGGQQQQLAIARAPCGNPNV